MKTKFFRAVRPVSNDKARIVASLPYDTVNTKEARQLAEGNPISFMRVVRSEIELPDDVNPYSDEVYRRASDNLANLIEQGALMEDQEASYYIYSQKMGDHIQYGIVLCCHADDYDNGAIKLHENTRPDKEEDRLKHILTVGANTGLVFLTYRGTSEINAVVENEIKNPPLYSFMSADGIDHTVWKVQEANKELQELFEKVPNFYVADGHHRARASSRARAERRAANAKHTGNEEYNWFLAAVFPSDQLNIMPYNRCVRDLNNLGTDDFLARLSESFRVFENAGHTPVEPHKISMYLKGKWYSLEWNAPEMVLDCDYLQDNLLAPMLGITNPRSDSRIEFVGGIRGTDELVQKVDSGEFAVAFSMYPVTTDQVMAVADAGKIMPPKSTWFEPKLRSGLLIHNI